MASGEPRLQSLSETAWRGRNVAVVVCESGDWVAALLSGVDVDVGPRRTGVLEAVVVEVGVVAP